jgi:hypothetical protein
MQAHVVEITKLVEYVESNKDLLVQTVRRHQRNINSAMLQTARCLKTELQRGTRQMKDSMSEKIKERRRGKRMHGQYPCNLDEKLVNNEESHSWLNLETLRKKKKVQQRQQLAQTVLTIKV